MEFMKVQHHDTRQIIKWFVDKKKVAQKAFENAQEKERWKGKTYNTSYTVRDAVTNNIIHVHHYN